MPLAKLSRSQLQLRATHDLNAVLQYRKGLQQTLAFILANPAAFPPEPLTKNRLLDAEQRELVRETWKNLLDFVLFLDGQEQPKHAIRADEAEFNRTWTRPKWHVFMQGDTKTGMAETRAR